MRTYSPLDPGHVDGPTSHVFLDSVGQLAYVRTHYDPSWINRLDCEAVK